MVETLSTTLRQQIGFSGSKRKRIIEIKPYIYMHNAPSGNFTLTIMDLAENVIASQGFDSDDIKTALNTTDNYAHVYLPISFNLSIEPSDYLIELSASGYSYDVNSYIGWVKEWEGFYLTKNKGRFSPLGLRVLTYDNKNS
jgi:hypothetical protein